METRDWLVIDALPGVGALSVARLSSEAPAWPDGWLARLPGQASAALRLWLSAPERSPLQAQVEAALNWEASADNRHLLHPDHSAWPSLLNQIADPPPVLWALGALAPLSLPGIAMVGTRHPSAEGHANAKAFGADLARSGWCVISGMALGIDGLAQDAALNVGGSSIAVLASGIDVVYPSRHRHLYQRLASAPGGLLLAEHPLGTRARPGYFPRRNRIVTGLGLGTLVVEAAEKSGSMISARLALEQGRELFAIPGSIHNAQARGCLQLIRAGANLVRCRQDIQDELKHWAEVYAPPMPPPLAGDAPLASTSKPDKAASSMLAEPDDPVFQQLVSEPQPIDWLVQQTGLGVGDCQRRLLMLELDGWAEQRAGGWVRGQPG